MLPKLEEIKKRRKRIGLTQFQLAKEAGVSQSFITKVEAGKTEPSYSKAENIFSTLDSLEKEAGKKVKDLMSRGLLSVSPGESTSAAIAKMKKRGVSQLPVLDDKRLVGSVSERGIFDRLSGGESMDSISKLSVFDIMGDAFPTVPENTPVDSTLPLLQQNQAILVTRKGKLAGILTKADLLKG